MIEAILTSSTAATALGLAVTHKHPILALCRALVDAEPLPRTLDDDRMTVYRDGTPELHIPSITASARRTIVENDNVGPKFGRWAPFAGFASEAGIASGEEPVGGEGSGTDAILERHAEGRA